MQYATGGNVADRTVDFVLNLVWFFYLDIPFLDKSNNKNK